MPLKPRSRVLQEPATVASRERPTADDVMKKAAALDPEPPLDDSEDEGLDVATNDAPTDITDDGENAGDQTPPPPSDEGNQDSGDEAGSQQTAPTAARRGRPPRAVVANEPGEVSADPKARMSEIQREMKQTRSDYTSELKRLEAEFTAKAKALRSEYDVLNTQVTEATFTL